MTEKEKIMKAYSDFIGVEMVELPEDGKLVIINEDDVLVTFDLTYNTYFCEVAGEPVYIFHYDEIDTFIEELGRRDFTELKEKLIEIAKNCGILKNN